MGRGRQIFRERGSNLCCGRESESEAELQVPCGEQVLTGENGLPVPERPFCIPPSD